MHLPGRAQASLLRKYCKPGAGNAPLLEAFGNIGDYERAALTLDYLREIPFRFVEAKQKIFPVQKADGGAAFEHTRGGLFHTRPVDMQMMRAITKIQAVFRFGRGHVTVVNNMTGNTLRPDRQTERADIGNRLKQPFLSFVDSRHILPFSDRSLLS